MKMVKSEPIEFKSPKLHKGQKKIVDFILKNKKVKFHIICSSRQAGKSFLLKNLILYYSINYRQTVSLIVSPFNSQNLKIYDELYNSLFSTRLIASANRTEKTIRLVNGSQLIFKSAENADSIRGITSDFIFGDEFAFFKENVWTEAILPTIAAKKDAKAFVFSTPKGKNEFYKLSLLGQDPSQKAYAFHTMSYLDNPMMDLEFINLCRKTYPKAKFEQEFENKFVDSASVFNDYEHCCVIEEYYKEPYMGEEYFAGLDLANKTDKTVLTILNQDGVVCDILAINKTRWQNIVQLITEKLQQFNAKCIIEVNSIGDVVYDYIEEKYQNISPIVTNNKNKQDYIENLIYSLNNTDLLLPTRELSPELTLQLDSFELVYNPSNRTVKYQGMPGVHDDYVISLALANKALKEGKTTGEYHIKYL